MNKFFEQKTCDRYSSQDGVLFNKEKTSLIRCPSGKKGNYLIPASVINIENCAFLQCAELNGVEVRLFTQRVMY